MPTLEVNPARTAVDSWRSTFDLVPEIRFDVAAPPRVLPLCRLLMKRRCP